MKRNEWLFHWNARQLLRAATARAKHHLRRAKFYAGEQARLRKQIGVRGLQIHENVTAGAYLSTSYDRPQVTVEAQLLAQYQRAAEKVNDHTRKKMEFEGWAVVFGRLKGGETFALNADDVLYFHLGQDTED